MLGIVVGMLREARLAQPLGGRIIVGGGTASGAEVAAERLIASGATVLLSFGLAGGLDPTLSSGVIVVPRAVRAGGRVCHCDSGWIARLGGDTATVLLGLTRPATTSAEKLRLWNETGAVACDMESGPVAQVAAAHSIPFVVLRAIADSARCDLPPAACVALASNGRVRPQRLIASLVRHPGQINALLALAKNARAAEHALVEKVRDVGGLKASCETCHDNNDGDLH